MKVKQIVLGMALTVAAVSAMACPAGTHLVGGTGAHHKGGQCVKEGVSATKAEAKEKVAKTEKKASDTTKKTKKEAKKEAKAKADAAKAEAAK